MKDKFCFYAKGVVIAALALVLSACQQFQSRDEAPSGVHTGTHDSVAKEASAEHYSKRAGLKYDSKRGLIPVSDDGKHWSSCGTIEHNDCVLFKQKVKISEIKQSQVLYLDYHVNPHCQIVIINNVIYTDPNNPHCENYNPNP